MSEIADHANEILREVERAVVGKPEQLKLILTAIVAGGHVLIEDLPGLGKTMIARSFATVLGLQFKRVQCTPDLLPADLLGSTIYDVTSAAFQFRAGPIFTNVLMADEINRTPPKTQAALLEAMAERQVTVDGHTHELPSPFLVLATDNPIEYEGTYPLPEAELDRFAIRLRLGYLSSDDELAMLQRRIARRADRVDLIARSDAVRIAELQRAVESVVVHRDLLDYVVRLAAATRSHMQVEIGASPRAELDLVQLARVSALFDGRDFVRAEDLKSLVVPTFAHRITIKPELWVRRIRSEDVLVDILRKVAVPRAGWRKEDDPSIAAQRGAEGRTVRPDTRKEDDPSIAAQRGAEGRTVRPDTDS